MKILELFTGEQPLFIEENNKKYKKDLNEINKLINLFCVKYQECASFVNSESNINNISLAKGLNEYFQSKRLRLDSVLNYIKKTETEKLTEFNKIKTSLLNELNTINNPTEGIVSLFSIENGEFISCEEGKENVILGEHNNIINDVISMINDLSVESRFENTPSYNITYNTNTLESNLVMCRTKADVAYADKQGRLNKVNEVINKLEEVSHKVVAFYTYRNTLESIGCNPKFIKDYENELEKMYIPLKKTLQKELNIELEEICNVSVDESVYTPTDNEEITEAVMDSAISMANESNYEIQEETYQDVQQNIQQEQTYSNELPTYNNIQTEETTYNNQTTEETSFRSPITEETSFNNQPLEENTFSSQPTFTEFTTQTPQPQTQVYEQSNPFASMVNNIETPDNIQSSNLNENSFETPNENSTTNYNPFESMLNNNSDNSDNSNNQF